jgi:OPA family glycerol-3-phosphate transporter-like MFS transporter
MKNNYSRNSIVALCSAVYFVSYFSRKDFAAVMAGMLSENVIDKSFAGLIGTLMFVFYGVGQLISGYLGDKIKPKYLIYAGLFTTAICNLFMPLLQGSYFMAAVWGLNGLAQAMLWPPIVKILATHLDHKRFVFANLVVTSAAHVATILLYLYVPICLEYMSWETVFFTASVLSFCVLIVFAILMYIILPKNAENAVKKDTEVDLQKAPPIKEVLMRSGVIPIFVAIITCGFLRDGIESWLPTLYSEAFSRNASESIILSVSLPIFAIVSIVALTAVHNGKLFNNEAKGSAILFASAGVLSFFLALTINMHSPIMRIVSLVLAALVCALMHGINFLLISCLPGRFNKYGRVSTVGGLTNAFVYVGAAASMYGIAVISENFGWAITVITWMVIAIIGLLVSFLSIKKYGKFIYE